MSTHLHSGRFRSGSYACPGSGTTLVLVHGFPTDARIWEPLVPMLGGQFRLLLPDLPGSAGSPLKQGLSIEDMAEHLKDLLDQQEVERCVLVGHSMGGYAALAFAERYRDRLLGLGLFHSSAFADSEAKKEERLKSIGLMERYGSRAFLRQMIPNLFSARYRKEHPEVLQRIVQRYQDVPLASLVAYYRAMMQRPDRCSVLASLRVPVLFTAGGQDKAAPLPDLLQQIPLPAISDFRLWPEVGHMGMWEAPQAGPALASFALFCQQLQPAAASW